MAEITSRSTEECIKAAGKIVGVVLERGNGDDQKDPLYQNAASFLMSEFLRHIDTDHDEMPTRCPAANPNEHVSCGEEQCTLKQGHKGKHQAGSFQW